MKEIYSTASHFHLLTVELEGVPKVKLKKKLFSLGNYLKINGSMQKYWQRGLF